MVNLFGRRRSFNNGYLWLISLKAAVPCCLSGLAVHGAQQCAHPPASHPPRPRTPAPASHPAHPPCPCRPCIFIYDYRRLIADLWVFFSFLSRAHCDAGELAALDGLRRQLHDGSDLYAGPSDFRPNIALGLDGTIVFKSIAVGWSDRFLKASP